MVHETFWELAPIHFKNEESLSKIHFCFSSESLFQEPLKFPFLWHLELSQRTNMEWEEIKKSSNEIQWQNWLIVKDTSYRKVYNSERVHYYFLSLFGAPSKQGHPLFEGAY